MQADQGVQVSISFLIGTRHKAHHQPAFSFAFRAPAGTTSSHLSVNEAGAWTVLATTTSALTKVFCALAIVEVSKDSNALLSNSALLFESINPSSKVFELSNFDLLKGTHRRQCLCR